jgi:hypothetical protein
LQIPYEPNAEAEIAELRIKLRGTMDAALVELDRGTGSASSIQRLRDFMTKQVVVLRRLESYEKGTFKSRPELIRRVR